VKKISPNSKPSRRCRLLLSLPLGLLLASAIHAQTPAPIQQSAPVAEITAGGPQRKDGDLYIADKDVDVHYLGMHLQADHVEYNTNTSQAVARGNVVYDYQNEHLEADEAQMNVASNRGIFQNVRGSIHLERRPNPLLLVSENPLYFEAKQVDRISEDVYLVHHGWFTICDPKSPTWQFFAPEATVTLEKSVALVNANFRLYRVPLIWMPYATAPAGEHIRQSGFMLPILGNSNSKGFTVGDAFYWAPKTWIDATVGFEYFSKRGPGQRANLRARPFENTSIIYNYFGVEDRGIPGPTGAIEKQGGYEQQLEVQSLWSHGWRFVTDMNQLSSLTFRLAFAGTYGEAINSEIRSSVFLTNNFRGFSFNVDSLNDRSFLELVPENSVILRSAPEASFSTVEQSPWRNLPIYFSFSSFAGTVHRDDEFISTENFVGRTEFAPKVTIPIHFGDWLGVTT
jgi:LPS-assembly protein